MIVEEIVVSVQSFPIGRGITCMIVDGVERWYARGSRQFRVFDGGQL